MGLTIIYSCGPAVDFGGVVDRLKGNETVVWFPEIDQSICGKPVPVHPAAQIKMLPSLTGRYIVTMSEHIILMFLKKIRNGRMRPNDLMLTCAGRHIRVDDEGDLIDEWDGHFFHERAQLLF